MAINQQGKDGMAATAVAIIAGGQVTKLTVTQGGSHYDFGPQVSFLQ